MFRYWSFVWLVALLTIAPVAAAQQSEMTEHDTMQIDGQSQNEDQSSGEDRPHPTIASDNDPKLHHAVEQIVQRTNDFRQEHDRSPVKVNNALTETAVYFANYMARTGKYGHGADGNRPAGRVEEHGYEYCMVAENIAYLYKSQPMDASTIAAEFTTGWIESKGHRENMLKPAVTETGVAVAQDEQTGYYFAVQLFGRPRSSAIEFTVENRTEQSLEYRVTGGGNERQFQLPPRARMYHQRCLPPQLLVEPATNGEDAPQPLRRDVTAGVRYVITERDGQLQLSEEQRPTAKPEEEAEGARNGPDGP